MLLVEAEVGGHAPAIHDHFGTALAAGDFDQDGFADLAIGVPNNDCDAVDFDCGAVQVRLGGGAGLSPALVLDPDGVGQFGDLPPEPARSGDRYGAALASGDFNADGYADLVVGAPGNRYADQIDPGGVHIHYGLPASIGSIEWVAEHFLDQAREDLPGESHQSEDFGAALAVGDFDGNGHDDLAIGSPENWSTADELVLWAGNVVVAHGHVGGLVPVEAFAMELGAEGLPDSAEEGERFGYSLAAGDFDADGYDDLAIGVPREDDLGAVLVVYGSPFSLLFADHWYFGLLDLGATPQAESEFGASLAAGDFDGDGYDDLAVGAPFYDGLGGATDLGLVTVVYGSGAGLTAAGAHFFWEDLLGADSSTPGDRFGSALAAGDFNGDGVDDLAIGTDGEDLSGGVDAGAVTVRLGVAEAGAAGAARQIYNGAFPSGLLPEPRRGGALWGAALASGDFDGNGFADLAIGGPMRDTEAANFDSGAAAVLFGGLFVDDFESHDLFEWTAEVP